MTGRAPVSKASTERLYLLRFSPLGLFGQNSPIARDAPSTNIDARRFADQRTVTIELSLVGFVWPKCLVVA